MSSILNNKKIVISAGASGIGLAIAKVCMARGATIYVCQKRFWQTEPAFAAEKQYLIY